MRYHRYTLALPGNPEYSVPQLRMLLREVERGTGIRIDAERWDRLQFVSLPPRHSDFCILISDFWSLNYPRPAARQESLAA